MPLLFRWPKTAALAGVVFALLLTGNPAARQTTRYVNMNDPTCGDTVGKGATAAEPFCSVKYAATVANPGDTFLIEGGLYQTGPMVFSRSGTVSAPITYRGVGDVRFAIDLPDASFIPSPGLANVYQVAYTLDPGIVIQQRFDPIVIDDPNPSIFTIVQEDGPFRLNEVFDQATLVAVEGTWRLLNDVLYVHAYGHRVVGTATTDLVAGGSGAVAFTISTGTQYNVFENMRFWSTVNILGSNNTFRNTHWQGTVMVVKGSRNTVDTSTHTNDLRRNPAENYSWHEAATGGGVAFEGPDHIFRNARIFHNWNSGVGTEQSTNLLVENIISSSAPNHCSVAGGGNSIVRNAVMYNCQDYVWLVDTANYVIEHWTVPSGIGVEGLNRPTGPVIVRNSIFSGTLRWIRGPDEYCTYEKGSLVENSIISSAATVDRCTIGASGGRIEYPLADYLAHCASGKFTDCVTYRNNIVVDPTAWKTVIADGMWNASLGDQWNPRLVSGSPAIDLGTTSGATTDIEGTARPQGKAKDAGAFEGTVANPLPATGLVVAAPAAVTTTITAPTSAATYDAGTSATLTTLAGTSKSARTITGCTWANSLGGSGATTGTTSWTVPSIALTVGSNVVTVTCTNDGKTTGADVITVTRSSGGGLWACEDTHTAANLTLATVQALINSAPVDADDCVNLPAGTITWASPLSVTKAIQIRGNNGTPVTTPGTTTQCDVGAQTTYTCLKGTNRLMTMALPSSGSFRVTGITFYPTGCSDCDTYTRGIITIASGSPDNFRFDHNRIDPASTAFVSLGHIIGVIDHNIFNAVIETAHVLTFVPQEYDGTPDVNGDISWFTDHTKGLAGNIFVEDNTFTNAQPSTATYYSDGMFGSRAVWRYNTFDTGSVQVHGTETGGRTRGARHMEVYRNTFTQGAGTVDTGSFRGGSGYYFQNTMTGTQTGAALFNMSTLRRDDTDWAGHGGQYPYGRCGIQTIGAGNLTRSGTTATLILPNNWVRIQSNAAWITIAGAAQSQYNGTFRVNGISQTTVTFTVSGSPATPATGSITASSPFDGNTDATGYPCLDQAGSGKGEVLLSGTALACDCPPMAPDPATQNVKMNNALEPIACWLNTDDGAASNCYNQGPVDVIQANRDWYNHNTSCTGASCTAGVGNGATLPTGCTPTSPATSQTGPYFWHTASGEWDSTNGATADGRLYRCSATNTWTVFYTPYTYPHPLVQ